MDTFMDKLAQKLNAQEMIRANSAADAEEMSRLKNQAKEYSECLEQLRKLIDESNQKLENAKVDGGEINRLVEESLAKIDEKINELQKDTESIEELKSTVDAKLPELSENVHKECVKVYRNVQAVVVEENGKQTENVVAAVEGLKGKLNAILGVSIAALVVAVGSAIFQVLIYLNVI